jgi:hypothetical protein
MTGREYQILAGEPPVSDERAFDAIDHLIARGTIPVPSFVEDPGPVPHSGGKGYIIGPPPETAEERGAAASFYAATVADLCLDVLGSTTPIVIDGGFATNFSFAKMLSCLRPFQEIYVSQSKDGTALGAGLLWRRFQRKAPVTSVKLDRIETKPHQALIEATRKWKAMIGA